MLTCVTFTQQVTKLNQNDDLSSEQCSLTILQTFQRYLQNLLCTSPHSITTDVFNAARTSNPYSIHDYAISPITCPWTRVNHKKKNVEATETLIIESSWQPSSPSCYEVNCCEPAASELLNEHLHGLKPGENYPSTDQQQRNAVIRLTFSRWRCAVSLMEECSSPTNLGLQQTPQRIYYRHWFFKMAVFWDVAPRSLVDTERRFRVGCCLHH